MSFADMKVVALWFHVQHLPSDGDKSRLASEGYSKVVGKEEAARMASALQDERCGLYFPHTESFVLYHLVQA